VIMNAFDSKFQIPTGIPLLMTTTLLTTFVLTLPISSLAKESIPLKTILVRHNEKPWISSELEKDIRKRDRLKTKISPTKSS
jgi:hypothetical protein